MNEPQELSVYPLRLTLTAQGPIALDEHPGSSLRGALFGALLRRFCANPTAPSCADCPLHATCPVAGLVAPLRDERPRGRDVPRPFVLEPPPTSARLIQPGQTFTMGLTLIGAAIRFFPYVALATRVMEAHGIGRPLQVNAGRRGRFQIERIELVDPFAPARVEDDRECALQSLYTRDSTTVAAPTQPVTGEHIAARAASLPATGLTLHFLSPTRTIEKGSLTRTPQLPIIVARLAERLDALTDEYGQPPSIPVDSLSAMASAPPSASSPPSDEWRAERRERAQALIAEAARLRLVTDETRWVDVASYSARQGRATPIGGFIGLATWEGDLSPALRELLVWGELLHVGKNAVKGDGHYRIASDPA